MAQAPYCSRMAKPTPWKDQYTLLCEKCGYVLEGLDQAGVCPECGKSIAESLPERRVGTPWQKKASAWSLLKTWYAILRHPKRTFDDMECVEHDGISLASIGLIVSLASTWLLLFVIILFEGINEIGLAILFAFIGVIYWFIGFVYAWIAVARVRFAAKMKGYRIDGDAAWSIVGLASVGLSFGPISVLLGTMLLFADLLIFPYERTLLGSLVWLLFLLSIPVGLMVFEVLCSLGMRRCKFRNRLGTTLGWFKSSDSPAADAHQGTSRADMP